MKITETDTILEILPELFLKPPSSQEAIEIFNLMGFDSLSNITDVDLEIKKEFTRFFSAPGEHKLPPYESYWHLKKQQEDPINAPRLYSRTTDEIKEIYDFLEIETINNLHEPPDHIAFELSVYLSLLNVWDNVPDDLKKDFIDGHVMLWIPDYLKKLAEKKGYFYPQLAQYLLNTIFNTQNNV